MCIRYNLQDYFSVFRLIVKLVKQFSKKQCKATVTKISIVITEVYRRASLNPQHVKPCSRRPHCKHESILPYNSSGRCCWYNGVGGNFLDTLWPLSNKLSIFLNTTDQLSIVTNVQPFVSTLYPYTVCIQFVQKKIQVNQQKEEKRSIQLILKVKQKSTY